MPFTKGNDDDSRQAKFYLICPGVEDSRMGIDITQAFVHSSNKQYHMLFLVHIHGGIVSHGAKRELE